MSLQYGNSLRNAQLDQIAAVIGASAKLQIRTGAPPASCAAADSGTLLCEMALPASWMAAASNGVAAKSAAVWIGTAIADGIAGHFRFKDASGTTTHVQGVIAQGSGGDMTFDNAAIATGQSLTVDRWSFRDTNV